MDPKRLSNSEKLRISRIYFFAGLPCLPFLWWINVWCFFWELKSPNVYSELRSVQKYVILSLVGALLWTVVFCVWLIIYSTCRIGWGEFGDRISFNIPPGVY